jgi:hypothetical protein
LLDFLGPNLLEDLPFNFIISSGSGLLAVFEASRPIDADMVHLKIGEIDDDVHLPDLHAFFWRNEHFIAGLARERLVEAVHLHHLAIGATLTDPCGLVLSCSSTAFDRAT